MLAGSGQQQHLSPDVTDSPTAIKRNKGLLNVSDGVISRIHITHIQCSYQEQTKMMQLPPVTYIIKMGASGLSIGTCFAETWLCTDSRLQV